MWGKIIIPMCRLWLNGLYGLYGPRCPLSSKRPINLISLSLSLCRHMASISPNELKDYKQWDYVEITFLWLILMVLRSEFYPRTRAPSQWKDTLSRYGDFRYKYERVLRMSYLNNGKSYTGKITAFYWDSLQVNTIAAAALDPCIARPSTAIVLTIKNK